MLFTAFSPVKPLYGVNAKPNHMVAYFGNKTLYPLIKRLIMFQRRHYRKTAETLAEVFDVSQATVEAISDMFQRDNSNFSSRRFFAYFLDEYKRQWEEEYQWALAGLYD